MKSEMHLFSAHEEKTKWGKERYKNVHIEKKKMENNQREK